MKLLSLVTFQITVCHIPFLSSVNPCISRLGDPEFGLRDEVFNWMDDLKSHPCFCCRVTAYKVVQMSSARNITAVKCDIHININRKDNSGTFYCIMSTYFFVLNAVLLLALGYLLYSVSCHFFSSRIWILPLPPICVSKWNSMFLQTDQASRVILREDLSRCQPVAAMVVLCWQIALGFHVVDRAVLFPRNQKSRTEITRADVTRGEEEPDGKEEQAAARQIWWRIPWCFCFRLWTDAHTNGENIPLK